MDTWIITCDDSSKTTIKAGDIMSALSGWRAQHGWHAVGEICAVEMV